MILNDEMELTAYAPNAAYKMDPYSLDMVITGENISNFHLTGKWWIESQGRASTVYIEIRYMGYVEVPHTRRFLGIKINSTRAEKKEVTRFVPDHAFTEIPRIKRSEIFHCKGE